MASAECWWHIVDCNYNGIDAADAGTDGRVVAAHVPACPAPHMSPSHCWGTVGRDADSATGHMATLFVQNIAHSLPTCLSEKIFYQRHYRL